MKLSFPKTVFSSFLTPALLSIQFALFFHVSLCSAGENSGKIFVVTNQKALRKSAADSFKKVLGACTTLTGPQAERLLYADKAYRRKFEKPLAVKGYPCKEATGKASWLRTWLSSKVPEGSSIVLLGDEKALPRWEVSVGRLTLKRESDCERLPSPGDRRSDFPQKA